MLMWASGQFRKLGTESQQGLGDTLSVPSQGDDLYIYELCVVIATVATHMEKLDQVIAFLK